MQLLGDTFAAWGCLVKRLSPLLVRLAWPEPYSRISLTRETLIGGALVTVGRRGSLNACSCSSVFSHSQCSSEQEICKERGREQKICWWCSSYSSGLAMSTQELAFLGSAPSAGKKTILVVRAARLWISASASPVFPPDPAAEVGGIYI